MQYEPLIREAWRLTWRFRSLWVLGLFAGGSAGPSCSWTNRAPDTRTALPTLPGREAEEFGRAIADWVAANLGVIALIGSLIGLLVLVGAVVSLIAQGGLTRAGADAARGGTPTLGAAWAAGLHTFWRYLGLALLIVVFAIGVAIVVGIAIAIVVLLSGAGDGGPMRVLVALFLGIPLGLAGLALAFVVASTVAFAQRAIAIEDLGPVDALRAGWSLFLAHVGTCAVLWILNIALAIVAGIGIAIAVVVVAVPFVLVGVTLWLVLGVGTAVVAWAIVGAIALVAAALVLGSITGTFFWHYWTLAYLRLSAPPAAAS